MEPIIGDDTICIAIGTNIEESKLTLIRAFERFPRKKFCILHVHRRDHVIFSISQGFPPSSIAELNQLAKRADDIRDQILEECLKICQSAGKHVEKLHIEMDDVAEGIVILVRQHNIMNLVMGAGANTHLTEGATMNSKKASYVKRYVPPYCNVWFNCRGEFIHRRKISEFGSSSSSSSTYLTDSSRFERLYVEELRRGREAEAEIERLKRLRDEEKLRARDALLESRAKISSLVQQLEFCKKERDEQLGASSALVLGIPDEIRQPPSCFFCPISQDIMRDPHIAADGHTYEREYMSKWLSGKDTSPKTNLRLANRTLIPNLALRSAIQEWLQHHPSPASNNDQMEDSMEEDNVQAPTPSMPVFGQQPAAPATVFGQSAATPPSSGANPFQFGGQQSIGTPQTPNPFGSFSLGSY